MANYGIREDYQARANPAYFHDNSGGVVWQQSVYDFAAEHAEQSGCTTLIDLGCGRGGKLLPLMDQFLCVGVDTGDNIHYCQQHHTRGLWVDCDLSALPPKRLPFSAYLLNKALIICADVVEHLPDPQPCMRLIADCLRIAPAAVISTPDRERVYGYNHQGVPANPAHVREWTMDEFTSWVSSFGLRVITRQWVQSNSVDEAQNTILLLVEKDR